MGEVSLCSLNREEPKKHGVIIKNSQGENHR